MQEKQCEATRNAIRTRASKAGRNNFRTTSHIFIMFNSQIYRNLALTKNIRLSFSRFLIGAQRNGTDFSFSKFLIGAQRNGTDLHIHRQESISCRQNIGLIPRRNRSPFLGTSENVETKTAKESCDLSGNGSRSPNKTRQQPNIVPSSPILHAYGDDRGRLVVTTPTLATAAVAPPLTPSSKAGPPKTKLTVTAPRAREDPPPNPSVPMSRRLPRQGDPSFFGAVDC